MSPKFAPQKVASIVKLLVMPICRHITTRAVDSLHLRTRNLQPLNENLSGAWDKTRRHPCLGRIQRNLIMTLAKRCRYRFVQKRYCSNHLRHCNRLNYKGRFFFLITNIYARKLVQMINLRS